jgi:hypothetical protein
VLVENDSVRGLDMAELRAQARCAVERLARSTQAS